MGFSNDMPIYLQIVRLIKEEIARGDLKNGDKYPSVRDIAHTYKVNPNTVQRSMQVLEQEGLVEIRRGIGSFIVDDPESILRMKEELANSYMSRFLKRMENIGYSKEQAIGFLEDHDVR